MTIVKANRRQFLGATLLTGLPSLASASPVPVPRVAASALPPPSDTSPPLPDGAYARLGSRRFRTAKGISRIQFDPTGKALIGADRDEIRGWDVATAKPLFSMPYPVKVDLNSGRVTKINSIVALGRVDGANTYEIHHYQWSTGRTETRAKTGLSAIEQSAFTSDGSLVAIHTQGRLRVLDGKTAKELWGAAFGSNDSRAGDLQFLPGDALLIISGVDGVKLFDAKTGTEQGLFKTEKEAPKDAAKKAKARGRTPVDVSNLVASADATLLAGRATQDKSQILIWTVADAKLIQTLKTKDNDLPLGFSADARELIAESDGSLAFYSVETGKSLRTVDVGMSGLALGGDSRFVAASADDAIVLFYATTGKLHPLSADPPGLPRNLHYLDNTTLRGTLLAVGGWIEWSLNTNSARVLRPPSVGAAVPVGLAADGRTAVNHHDGKSFVWNLETGVKSGTISEDVNRSSPLAGLTRDGKTLLFATADGPAIWDVVTRKKLIIKAPTREVASPTAFAMSDDGERSALAGQMQANPQDRVHHQIELYSRTAEMMLHRVTTRGNVLAMHFSPDGTKLGVALGGNQQWGRGGEDTDRFRLEVYDSRSGRLQFQSPAFASEARVFAFSPDNRLLLTWTTEERVDVWELLSGKKRQSFPLKGNLESLAVSPDGESFATSGTGGPVLLWDLRGRRRSKLARPDAKQINDLCATLGSDDAEAALSAIRIAAAWPDEMLPVLAAKIEPVKAPDAKALQKWIEDLNASAFRDREKASRELQALGELAGPSLRAALATTDSDEVRQRAGDLLDKADTPSAADLRTLRAVEAAEWAGGAMAAKVLGTWATGAAGARLTLEAKAALKRMQTH
ncbi:hypothetical protein BH11PLA2_BH11PLA2_47780 [soil metagenome]